MKTIMQTYLGVFFLFLLMGCSMMSLTAAMNDAIVSGNGWKGVCIGTDSKRI